MEWTGDPLIGRGVREQGFRVECDGRTVPGLLWTTESGDEACPLVLLGHGGTTHKRADYILATARRLVRHHGISALAIDGPGHGERRSEAEGEMLHGDFEKAWQRPEATDETIADWKATLDAVQAQVGVGPVGYFGLSMGTMMGLPLVAAEPRVRAALLGLMGVLGSQRATARCCGARGVLPRSLSRPVGRRDRPARQSARPVRPPGLA